jgi:hypothetical protein
LGESTTAPHSRPFRYRTLPQGEQKAKGIFGVSTQQNQLSCRGVGYNFSTSRVLIDSDY